MVVLDTNIIIQYIKNDRRVVSWITRRILQQERFVISTITVIELLGYKYLQEDERVAIERLLSDLHIIDLDVGIAKMAAVVRATYGVHVADGAIIATALLLRLPLVTCDAKFKKVKGLGVIVPA